jgi:hypothetical protein
VNSNDTIDVVGMKTPQPYFHAIMGYLQKNQKIQIEFAGISGTMDEQNLVEKVFNAFFNSFGKVLQTFNGNLQFSTFIKLLT